MTSTFQLPGFFEEETPKCYADHGYKGPDCPECPYHSACYRETHDASCQSEISVLIHSIDDDIIRLDDIRGAIRIA